jgi:hypothetical protein
VVVDIVDHRGEVRGHRGVARRPDPGLPAADDRRRCVRAVPYVLKELFQHLGHIELAADALRQSLDPTPP